MAILCSFAIPASAAGNTENQGRLLDSYQRNDESTFTLSESSRLYISAEKEPTGAFLKTVQLVQKQFAADGYNMEIVWGPATWAVSGDILIVLDASCDVAAEGYRLSISEIATVTTKDTDGLLYGLNMLQKHIRAGGSTLVGFEAQDAPDTVQRAVSLDCGRKYYTKNWICNFIRQMSWMGYNTLELHFSDDSGFRFDIWDPAYYTSSFSPKNDFTWLCGSNYTSWTLSDYKKDPDKGKYLNTSEIIEILNTAKEYHIEVIPAFDSPSHLDYTTWMYEQNYNSNPEYSFYSTYYDKTFYAKDVNGCINYTGARNLNTDMQWPYYTTIDITDDQAKAFIFELHIDIANFFKTYAGSTNFSIGADEVNLNPSNLASGYSFKWEFSDFVDYINKLNELLNSKKYTMRMYNDFIGSTTYNASSYDFAPNIEILYWDSPFNPAYGGTGTATQPVSYYVNKGMTVYNCIQTHTYYALRNTQSGSDARDSGNRQWTFHHSTEEKIYNEWVPNNVREIGDYEESEANGAVKSTSLGGAYFLIWGDYACVSTEKEIWEGAAPMHPNANNDSMYYLLDRMWSNIVKMWNWDINDTVSYADYAAVRNSYGYFPGYTSCTKATTLSATVKATQAYLADHSALTAALEAKASQDAYTEESYAAYEAAYAAAEALNANHGATAEELVNALAELKAAEETLVLRPLKVTVLYKTAISGKEKEIKQDFFYADDKNYQHYIAPVTGYTYKSCNGTSFTPSESGDGSGFISGTLESDITVTLYYDNTPDVSRLDYLVRNAITDPGDTYTEDSWAEYQSTLAAARSFSVSDVTMQQDIDALVMALETSQNNLIAKSNNSPTIVIEKLTPNARLGKQIGLKIVTGPDVAGLTITNAEGKTEKLTLCVGRVQTLPNGSTVKIWLVYIPADKVGAETFTIADSGNDVTGQEATVEVTIK